MGRLSLVTGAVVATLGLAAACGDGSGNPTREISVDDLALMVLQREDVPSELTLLEEDGQDGAQPAYGTYYQLPLQNADAGETVCIGSNAVMLESAAAANLWFESEREGLTAATGGSVIEESALSQLGNEAFAIRFPSGGAGFCAPYDNEPTEPLVILFRIRNVVGSLITFVYEPGGPIDDALSLAQKQADRMQAVFDGDDSQ